MDKYEPILFKNLSLPYIALFAPQLITQIIMSAIEFLKRVG
jgi:hypothetical protein